MANVLNKMAEIGIQISDDAMTSDAFPRPGAVWVCADSGIVSLRGLRLLPNDADGLPALQRLNSKIQIEVVEQDDQTRAVSSEKLASWSKLAQTLFIKGLISAMKATNGEQTQVLGVSTGCIMAKASPGFANIGVLSEGIQSLHAELFPNAQIPALSALGVVCLPQDAPLALDLDIRFKPASS